MPATPRHTKRSWKLWAAANNVPPVPEAYRAQWDALSSSIKYWAPDYDVGDSVVIRPGTLGNMDGKCVHRKVTEFFWKGSHLCVRLAPPYQHCEFVASVYVKA